MKKLILLSLLSFNAFIPLHSQDTLLMITFPKKEEIINKVNPNSWYILKKINILTSIEKKTLSHIQLKDLVEKAFDNYNRLREISDISDFWINHTVNYLIQSGICTYSSKSKL